jgi:hypothetical protein
MGGCVVDGFSTIFHHHHKKKLFLGLSAMASHTQIWPAHTTAECGAPSPPQPPAPPRETGRAGGPGDMPTIQAWIFGPS